MVTFEPEPKKKPSVSAEVIVSTALIFAVLSIITYFANIPAASTIFGAMGLLAGGFSFGRAFTAQGSRRTILTAIVAASLICSVIGFMLGFAGLLG